MSNDIMEKHLSIVKGVKTDKSSHTERQKSHRMPISNEYQYMFLDFDKRITLDIESAPT